MYGYGYPSYGYGYSTGAYWIIIVILLIFFVLFWVMVVHKIDAIPAIANHI